MTQSDDPREAIVGFLPQMRAFAISLTRDIAAADDLVQDTIVKAWTNIDKFAPGTNMQAWLFTILRNTFYSGRRKASREVSDTDGVFASQLSVRPDHDGKLAFAEFRRAFDLMSAEHREVLILIGASGFTTDEAAKMIGVAPGTIKSRTSRARKLLADAMGMADGESVTISGLDLSALPGRVAA